MCSKPEMQYRLLWFLLVIFFVAGVCYSSSNDKYLMDYGIIIRYEMNVSVDNSPEIPLSSEIGNRLDIILI